MVMCEKQVACAICFLDRSFGWLCRPSIFGLEFLGSQLQIPSWIAPRRVLQSSCVGRVSARAIVCFLYERRQAVFFGRSQPSFSILVGIYYVYSLLTVFVLF